MTAARDPLRKRLLRSGYRQALLWQTRLSGFAPPAEGAPRVFYGGAFSGDVGGPLVKVKRLREHFPEHRWRYNLVYALSNAPYLPSIALTMLRRRGVPLVHNQNGVFWPGWYDGDWRAQNAIMAQSYHGADYVLWQSAFCRRSADLFLGERGGPGEVLYNAIDTARFTPPASPPDGPFTVLLTGKIGAHMAYRLLGAIAGLAKARAEGLEARLTVAGAIAEPALVEAQETARALGVAAAVRFAGPYTQESAPDIYRGAHAYINTTYKDACPNAVIEALASGLPVAYSRSGGAPELVGSEAGVGIEMPDVWDRVVSPTGDEIGAALLVIAADRERMAAAARERAVRRFDIGAWIARHREVFAGLLRKRA